MIPNYRNPEINGEEDLHCCRFGSRKVFREMDVFENVQTDSDSAWDFEPIFVDSQALDF